MYNYPINNNYNNQLTLDRINSQITELEKMKQQIQHPPQQQSPTNLTQNFQLAPTNRDNMKYANSIDEVQKDVVVNDTPYFSRDMSVVWIKNVKGDIKTYELKEIVPKDEKDIQIEFLQSQIEELKGMIKNEWIDTNVNTEQVTEYTEANNNTAGTAIKANKPTSVSKVSRSKKEQ